MTSGAAVQPNALAIFLDEFAFPGGERAANPGRNGREAAKSCPLRAERRLYSRHGCFKEEPGCGAALKAPRVKIQVKPGTLPQRPGSLNEKDVRS